MQANLFAHTYKNKRVLITGHTGFKGSWLALWLKALGAEVAGYSAYLPSDPCNFEVLKLKDGIADHKGDVRDFNHLREVFQDFHPEVVFHLAAQPIVRQSYESPRPTFDTNIGGTVNVLECLRDSEHVRAAVIITSDKCYQNVEWLWGYRENDPLGGDDPYSASKACAELVTRSYCRSIIKPVPDKPVPAIATTRAGNVIGGGDWAADRIVPDCVRAWSVGKPLLVRNPQATRPWQHVLEPLSGYLCIGADLMTSGRYHGEAYNFGPDANLNKSVGTLIEQARQHWPEGRWETDPASSGQKKESTLLKLSCEKAQQHLSWRAAMTFDETLEMTIGWYRQFYTAPDDMAAFALGQIQRYIELARARNIAWADGGDGETK